ncbi:hypothetical protein EV424DRAFT_1540191 [Suillus variegatus]|nr:hypothetical protein EV424DRAFT_1540191 [Suillus variegatus]
MRVGQQPSSPSNSIESSDSGRINLDTCARLRGLTPTGTTSASRNLSLSPTRPTFFPAYPSNQALVTPRRRIVSLPCQLEYQGSPLDSPLKEETGSPTFLLQPARFTPSQDDSTSSSPTTTSSLTATRPTPTPSTNVAALPIKKQSSSPPLPMASENPRTVPLFRGDYANKEEPTEWFAQFELSMPASWNDSQRISRFEMQLAPGNIAEEWFQDIAARKSFTFSGLKIAFRKRWPPPKRPKYTRAQQKEWVMAELLEEDEIGVWAEGNYGHVTWASKVSRLALGMGDTAGHLIEYMLEGIPDLLKDHLKCDYDSWDDFIEDVQRVPSVKLKRGREDLDKERARDADIARLKAQNVQRLSAPTYRTTFRTATPPNPMPANVVGNTYPSPYPTLSAPIMNNPMMPMRGGFNARGMPFMRAQLTRAQILEKLSATPQRANTEAGRRQYEADVELWHRTHGAEGFQTLEKPYPLRPGTAVLGSGECYNCGMVTEPLHVSTQCIAQEPLRPQESRWRQQVAGLIRRTASPMNRPSYLPTPVQHITATTYPQYGAYGTAGTMPIYTVAPQEELGGWSGQDHWIAQEPGQDWVPENYMEPLPMLDQQ